MKPILPLESFDPRRALPEHFIGSSRHGDSFPSRNVDKSRIRYERSKDAHHI